MRKFIHTHTYFRRGLVFIAYIAFVLAITIGFNQSQSNNATAIRKGQTRADHVLCVRTNGLRKELNKRARIQEAISGQLQLFIQTAIDVRQRAANETPDPQIRKDNLRAVRLYKSILKELNRQVHNYRLLSIYSCDLP